MKYLRIIVTALCLIAIPTALYLVVSKAPEEVTLGLVAVVIALLVGDFLTGRGEWWPWEM